jgi:hypothetical protein
VIGRTAFLFLPTDDGYTSIVNFYPKIPDWITQKLKNGEQAMINEID